MPPIQPRHPAAGDQLRALTCAQKHIGAGESHVSKTETWGTRAPCGAFKPCPPAWAIHFPEAYASKGMAQSAPLEMSDAQGNRLELIRDQQRNLLEIRTPHKRWIKFKYDDQWRIARAEDGQGQWAEYHYSENGMLTDASCTSTLSHRCTSQFAPSQNAPVGRSLQN